MRLVQTLKKALGKNAMSKPRIYEWYKYFQACDEIEDDKRTGHPTILTTKVLKEIEGYRFQ